VCTGIGEINTYRWEHGRQMRTTSGSWLPTPAHCIIAAPQKAYNFNLVAGCNSIWREGLTVLAAAG
jgi:hypothetical protein